MFCSLFGGQIYTENVCSPVTSVRLQILILRKPLCPVRTNHQHGMFELEELGQYIQRNSIVFHGLKENSDNTTEAKIKYVKDHWTCSCTLAAAVAVWAISLPDLPALVIHAS